MKKRYLILTLIILSICSIFIGVKDISFVDIFKSDDVKLKVLLISRIPRLISIIIVGATMSIAGLIMQQISRNKFVSPDTASTIGPNGAGKSTLLSIISRLITKDEGQVFIDGIEASKWDNKSLAKKIPILKQSNHTNIMLTIKELVSFVRFPYCSGNLSSEDLRYVNDAINYLELKDIENKYLDELSGGQRQRAYIAMIVAQNTEYILLDEPLNNLDMKHSVQIMKILKRLVQDLNKTVILVIHDINFASCYSDYIVALKNGIIAS